MLGYCLLLAVTLSFALFSSSEIFSYIPMRGAMSVDIVNTSNSTINNAEIRFYVKDYKNASRIRFSNIVNSTFQVPNNTWIGPITDGSGFTLYVPEWHSNQHAQFMVDNISITSDFPTNLSSLGYPPILLDMSNESSFDYSTVLTIIGSTFHGTQSIASLHQFTYNGVTQPAERRVQAMEYAKGFIALSFFLGILFSLWIWFPDIRRRLPFVTIVLAMVMVFLYAFVGSGREILSMPPYPWNYLKIWPFGTFMHAYDDHISGNLTVFVPLSVLLEVWLNAKDGRRRFLIWYVLPILIPMFLVGGVGFSLTNEFLAWALWSLIIVRRQGATRLDLLLSMFSGVMAYTFFGWLFGYLPYIFSDVAGRWWGFLAQNHIFWGLVGAVIFGFVTLGHVKQKAMFAVFKEEKQKPEQKQLRDLSEKEKMQTQWLISKLSTRENSTLVFSTVAASASLAILVLTLELPRLEWFSVAFWMGFLFSLVGFLYREATIFGIDIEEHKQLNTYLGISNENCEKNGTTWLCFFRMIMIRLFLLVPVGNWILICFNVQAANWIALACVILLGVAISLSIHECEKRQNLQVSH